MTGISPIYVGQVVYRHMRGKDINEFNVYRVGKKYFYVSELGDRYPISKETLKYENKQYTQSNIQFYLTKQEILDTIERRELLDKIKNFFQKGPWSSFSAPATSLDQLRSVVEILKIDENN